MGSRKNHIPGETLQADEGDTPPHKKNEGAGLDSYGFELRELTVMQREQRNACHAFALAALPQWAFLPLGRPFPRASKLKKLVRNGVPLEYRSRVWMHVSGAAVMRAGKPANYFRQLAVAETQSSSLHQIQLDLPRTYPGHPWVVSQEGQLMLQRVLAALSLHCPKVGYCQGLNFVAAVLLLATNKEEESTFWLLAALVEQLLLPNTYSESLEGCLVEMRALGILLPSMRPKLGQHLLSISADPLHFSADWFLCLFCTSFPPETAARVLDALFNEGAKILLRVSLALLMLQEEVLLKCDHSGEVIVALKAYAASMHDCNRLMAAAFRGIGGLPMSKVKKARAAARIEAQEVLRKRQAGQQRQVALKEKQG